MRLKTDDWNEGAASQSKQHEFERVQGFVCSKNKETGIFIAKVDSASDLIDRYI